MKPDNHVYFPVFAYSAISSVGQPIRNQTLRRKRTTEYAENAESITLCKTGLSRRLRPSVPLCET